MTLGLRSALLDEAGFRHAFFMRRGGVSPAPWESLNFSSASGDHPERVTANLERAAAEIGASATKFYYLSQVHGTAHRVLDGSEDRQAMLRVEGDITVTRVNDVACAVRMADCAAILMGDRRSGAVAAIHSGWRGTVQGAAAQGVRVLRELLGDGGDLVAAVGPHIEQCCFEVGPDVAETIAEATPLGDTIVDRSRQRPHVDLRRVIERQLHDIGVEAVDHVRGCTMCDPVRFHSYRREGVKSGRMLAAVLGGTAAGSARA
jgi:YfiH family protein